MTVEKNELNYCPHCGAKMDAGTKYEAEYMALIQLARLREKEWLENERNFT